MHRCVIALLIDQGNLLVPGGYTMPVCSKHYPIVREASDGMIEFYCHNCRPMGCSVGAVGIISTREIAAFGNRIVTDSHQRCIPNRASERTPAVIEDCEYVIPHSCLAVTRSWPIYLEMRS